MGECRGRQTVQRIDVIRCGVSGSQAQRRYLVGFVACLLFGLLLSGCAGNGSVPEGYYKIRKGDTLSEIAVERRISMRSLIRWNGLRRPYTIYAGNLLRIAPPDGRAPVTSGRAKSSSTKQNVSVHKKSSTAGRSSPRVSSATKKRPSTVPAKPGSRASASGVVWAWPLNGTLQQGFRSGDRTHQGLRIGCQAGSNVNSAASGRVVYSGSGLKGYGNLIIIKHNKNYLSAYGFNRRLFVKEGDSIKRGQPVAECGQGPGGANMLHFEVRRGGTAVNPVLYLPPRT